MTFEEADEIICSAIDFSYLACMEDDANFRYVDETGEPLHLIKEIAQAIDLINGALEHEYDIFDTLPEIRLHLANAWAAHEARFLSADDIYLIAPENINKLNPVIFTDEFFMPDMTGKTMVIPDYDEDGDAVFTFTGGE